LNARSLSKKRALNIDHFYLRLHPTVIIALIPLCHTRFSVENRMHLICVLGSQFHTYDRLMSVLSQDIAQNVQKRFINFYYTNEGRPEGLYTNNDSYEDVTPSSSSTGF
jgi:GTP cyclohydrolase II